MRLNFIASLLLIRTSGRYSLVTTCCDAVILWANDLRCKYRRPGSLRILV